MGDFFLLKRQNRGRGNAVGATVSTGLALMTLFGSSALAAQKTATKTGVAAESPMSEAPPLARDLPPRQVEIVVVWGFRLRTTEHDLRVASVLSGYGELNGKGDCITSICGFVVVQDGTTWRATNVVAASETELQDMQRNMERSGTTLVIVHPNGTKRPIPNF